MNEYTFITKYTMALWDVSGIRAYFCDHHTEFGYIFPPMSKRSLINDSPNIPSKISSGMAQSVHQSIQIFEGLSTLKKNKIKVFAHAVT